MADVPEKPHLLRFLEAIASILGLTRGRHRLELVFENGRLVQFWTHAEKRSPAELARFDADAEWLVYNRSAPAP